MSICPLIVVIVLVARVLIASSDTPSQGVTGGTENSNPSQSTTANTEGVKTQVTVAQIALIGTLAGALAGLVTGAFNLWTASRTRTEERTKHLRELALQAAIAQIEQQKWMADNIPNFEIRELKAYFLFYLVIAEKLAGSDMTAKVLEERMQQIAEFDPLFERWEKGQL